MSTNSEVINYLNNQASDVFTGADSSAPLTSFQFLISHVLIFNETGDENSASKSAYKLSHHGSPGSSFTFGAVQWDIAAFQQITTNSTGSLMKLDPAVESNLDSTSFGMKMLEQILRYATISGKNILTDKEITQILDKLGGNGERAKGNPKVLGDIVNGEIDLVDKINAALDSAYGQKWVNIWHQQYLQDLDSHVNTVVNSANSKDKTWLESSEIARLWIADFRNQFDPDRSIDTTSQNVDLVDFIQGRQITMTLGSFTRTVQKIGDLGYDDILNFYFNVPTTIAGYAADFDPDKARRFSNILRQVTAPITINNDEEAKGLARIYQEYIKVKMKYQEPLGSSIDASKTGWLNLPGIN